MDNTSKRAYSAPSLTEFGTVQDLTQGTGWTHIDFWFSRNDSDGNPWGVGDGHGHGGSHTGS